MNRWTRRQFLAAAAVAAVRGRAAETKKPNILFLFADDMRFSTIGALGYPVRTPNLDTLVRRGTAFTHACIPGGTSGAVCIPSRAMLMTGRTPYRLNNKIGDHPTWPEAFRRTGYTTFLAGKWHNEPAAVVRSFSGGGPIFLGGMGKTGEAGGVKIVTLPVVSYDGQTLGAPTPAPKDATELFADAAVKFLQDDRDEKPFALYVPFTSPHDPRIAPRRFHDLYDPAKIELPPNFLPHHPFDNGALKIRDEELAAFPRSPDEIRRHIADYYASISHLDEQIGRILAALEKSGRAANTIVVFAGDNGLALGQHGLMGKQSVYEHSVRVPLLIAGPGIPAGQRTDAFAYLLDLFPTLCDLAGVAAPAGLEGVSLAPVIRGDKTDIRDDLFFGYLNLHRSVRTRDMKLIEYEVKGERHTQLFDLAADPWETKNLAADPAHAATLARLRARLREWQEKLDDPLLRK